MTRTIQSWMIINLVQIIPKLDEYWMNRTIQFWMIINLVQISPKVDD